MKKITMYEQFTFIEKGISTNKCNEVVNYKPATFEITEFNNIKNKIKKIYGDTYFKNVLSELYFLCKKRSEHDLWLFFTEHPFWKKESDFNLLKKYNKLYYQFFNKNNGTFSKNNISIQNGTCISSLMYHGAALMVMQRSCDLSLGFSADLLTLILIAEKKGLSTIYWTINVPHVYINNYAAHINMFENGVKEKMIFNIREKR